MNQARSMQNALISVFYKDGLDVLAKALNQLGINIYSTGGTQDYIEQLGIKVNRVEDLTEYPSILGGRVKTLHPKVFGGILARRSNEQDQKEMAEFNMPYFDLVVVDLYPFEETLASTNEESKIIEKIDIGGVSLIRAGAKNHNDACIICNKTDYAILAETLLAQNGTTSIEQRRMYAAKAFATTAAYDTIIQNYFNQTQFAALSTMPAQTLRYGENPHQKGVFYGDINGIFTQLHGKELSYNNLLDLDAATHLIEDFEEPTVAVIKHNNPCGLASRATIAQAWTDALAGDPVSAFGGILISNTEIDFETAEEIHKLFCEVVIAPSYSATALTLLKSKNNRIILVQKPVALPTKQIRTLLNGIVEQDKDAVSETETNLTVVTNVAPTEAQIKDLLFANKLAKHTKSNTIVIARNNQLIASGTGQTSRVDALKQAINKALAFGFDLKGSVMASDAFFPFADCVEIAHKVGIDTVIQPGGSIKDKDSIEYCNAKNMSMVFTGTRHFKH